MDPTTMQQKTAQMEDDIAASLQRTTNRLEQTEELAYRTGAALAEQGEGIDRIQRRLDGLDEDVDMGERQMKQLETPWWKVWRRGSLFRRHKGLDLDRQAVKDDLAAAEAASVASASSPASASASSPMPSRRRSPTSSLEEVHLSEAEADAEEENDPLDNIQRLIANIKAAAAEQQAEVASQNAKLEKVEVGVDDVAGRTERLNVRQKRKLRQKRRWFF